MVYKCKYSKTVFVFFFRTSQTLFMLQLRRSRHFSGLLGHVPPRYRLPVDRHHRCETWRLHHAGEMKLWKMAVTLKTFSLFFSGVDSLFRMQFIHFFSLSLTLEHVNHPNHCGRWEALPQLSFTCRTSQSKSRFRGQSRGHLYIPFVKYRLM